MNSSDFKQFALGSALQERARAMATALLAGGTFAIAGCFMGVPSPTEVESSKDSGAVFPSRDAGNSPSRDTGSSSGDDFPDPRDASDPSQRRDSDAPSPSSDPSPTPEGQLNDCGSTTARYSVLPDGTGGSNVEGVSYACLKSFDKKASLAAFQSTVYPLLKANCASCHSTETKAQAPIHSDSDVNLAHEYALTRVDFRHPEDSKLAFHVGLYAHHCFGRNCSDAQSQLTAAVKSWAAAVQSSLPEVPRSVPENTKVSEDDVKQWIASDKAKLAAADAPYTVYVSLHEMHNAGVAADRLNMARAALSKALNSTARWAPKIVNPVDINGKGMVYRFDTRSYWGYNKGVKALIFGGSDDDIFFGDQKQVLSHHFNYTRTVSEDPNFAKMVWARVQRGSDEAPHQSGKAVNNKGFKSDYVELSQLVYTLSRPDVYNAIMAIPCYAEEFEDELGLERTQGIDSYQYVTVETGITFTATPGPGGGRQMFRGKIGSNGYYWKSFDMFTGSGQVFPGFDHPIPKFVLLAGGDDNKKFSLLATLAQPQGSAPAGCDIKGSFCTHYTGTGGIQQHASETFWTLPNGLMGFAIFGGLNQRRTDAFTIIVNDPRRARSAANNGGNPRSELRLNNPASCMGCHEEAMKRENNDLRDKLDDGSLKASWTSDKSVVDHVRKLYPETKALRKVIEDDHKSFLDAMLKIREGMMLGEDKNLYVEPIVNTFEWAQVHYKYADTLAN
jgi:cytochrome c553